jgi:hypothetical protein
MSETASFIYILLYMLIFPYCISSFCSPYVVDLQQKLSLAMEQIESQEKAIQGLEAKRVNLEFMNRMSQNYEINMLYEELGKTHPRITLFLDENNISLRLLIFKNQSFRSCKN